jgi:2-keto-4-pentenoate hydratase/2-oxohepta-3-ene-1,7-dioic acid hydratase in catechol pathway
MRIANVDGRLVTFAAGAVVDVATASDGRFGPDPQSAFRDWPGLVAWGASIGASGGAELDDALVGAPVPSPKQVFAIGLNYRAHALEGPFGVPDAPAVFTKFPNCIVGMRDAVRIPQPTTDYEVELVVVIGRRAYQVSRADAWSYVAGFTIGQDISERTMQRAGPAPQFGLAKSYLGFGPTGPWIVTLDEIDHYDDLSLSTTIGGETLQDARTSDLIFDVPFLIEYLSTVLPLEAGDLIFTGTPSGVGAARKPPRWLHAGETIVSRIEGIGELRTRLV